MVCQDHRVPGFKINWICSCPGDKNEARYHESVDELEPIRDVVKLHLMSLMRLKG
jgi:hypothetical protein